MIHGNSKSHPLPMFEVMTKDLEKYPKTYVATLVTMDSEGVKDKENYICSERFKITSKNTIRIRIKFLFHDKRLKETPNEITSLHY